MHWADIQAAILKAGYTQTKIAQMEGVSHSSVGRVIRGDLVSHNIAYAIAAITGIPTERMWPGKYLSPEVYSVVAKHRACETRKPTNPQRRAI